MKINIMMNKLKERNKATHQMKKKINSKKHLQAGIRMANQVLPYLNQSIS